MNEQELRTLLQESTLSPSDDFSRKLMREIQSETATATPIRWMPFVLGFVCILAVVLLAFFPVKNISLFNEALQIPSIGIQLSAILLLLYELHQILDLYKHTVDVKQLSKRSNR